MATPALLGGGGVKATAPATKPSQTVNATPLGGTGATTATTSPIAKTVYQALQPSIKSQYPEAMDYGMFQGSLMPQNQAGLLQYMRDWATEGGSRGVGNVAGTGMMNYSDVLDQMRAAGINVSGLPSYAAPSGPANPYGNLLNQYNDIYKGVSGNVGSIYDSLAKQLAANRAAFSAETPRLEGLINTQYGSALSDVQGVGKKYQTDLASLAKQLGIPQAQMAEHATDLGSDLARIAALNATNRAASEANLALRGGTIGDLLMGNESAARQAGAAAQAGLATQALNRFGMADPETLLSQYETGVQTNQLAALNYALAQQKAALAAAGGGGSGGGGGRGGGGRKSGGGSSAATSTAVPANPYDAVRQWYANAYGTMPNDQLALAYEKMWNQNMPAYPAYEPNAAGKRVVRGQTVGPQ
jgi:hypothetical protein